MAQVRKTPIDKLNIAVKEILDDYKGSVYLAAKDVTQAFGKEGTDIIKQYSKREFNRHSRKRTYYTQWTHTKVDETQGNVSVTFYSRKYQLPHLLEYSHATGRNRGGHYNGRAHIAYAERDIVHEYEKALRGEL